MVATQQTLRHIKTQQRSVSTLSQVKFATVWGSGQDARMQPTTIELPELDEKATTSL